MSADQKQKLDQISSEIQIVGTRYPEQMMKAVDA
jgi:hypothetical protein